MRTAQTILVILLIAIAASPPAALATSFTVTASNFAWTPTPLGASIGDAVTFVNGGGSHTFVSDAGLGSCALPCTKTFTASGNYPYHCGVHASMRGTVTVGLPPTITITTPTAGATAQGILTVAGTATHPTSNISTVRVKLGSAAFVTATLASPGTTNTTWTAAIDTTTFPNGAQTVLARATSTGGLESDASVSVAVQNPTTLDVRAVSFTASDEGLTTSTLTYRLTNVGNVPTGIFLVKADYASAGAWRAVGSSPMELGPGATGQQTLTWDSGGRLVGSFEIRLLLDADARLAESDESNNEARTMGGFVTSAVTGVDVDHP